MLKLENVSFGYNGQKILKNLSFAVRKGEQIAVIGESGCGKSTLLQLIYGLHHTEGKIFWEERELLGPNFNLVPGEPFMKYLAQDFNLMLPLNVAENVGKFLSNMYPVKKKRRILELLEVVEMQDLAAKKAGELSGGQQQRVALARALAKEPEVLLLDEPFSHIDHFRKNNLRRRLYGYFREKDITIITATHDSTDALSFADRAIVLKDGRIHAAATPELLYNEPPDKYVASLFGDVNEVMLKDISPIENSRKKILLYPHEIVPVDTSPIRIKINQSFFKGENFLVKGTLQGKTVYFISHSRLSEGQEVPVEVSEEVIRARVKF